MQLFVVNIGEQVSKTYDELLIDLNQPELACPSSMNTTNIYEFYLQLIVSMILDKPFQIKGVGTSDNVYHNPYRFNSMDEVISRIKMNVHWQLEMETSGTTGLPKKVTHTFTSLTRNIKMDERRRADVWGLAYNPTHMAGLQVFFQAFLNKNIIVNLFGLSRDQVYEQIEKYNVSHISATPTFYKLLLPAKTVLRKVQQITFGGEKFVEGLQIEMKKIFPSARFTNVYASTEAGALFAANGNIFSLSEKNKSYVKIVEGELWIHKSVLSESSDLKLQDDWYASGDMVEVIQEVPLTFKFLARKNEMINVGGSKVNPNEVEELILKLNGVRDVKVFGKENSLMGNILCADVVSEMVTEKEIKSFLKNHLPGYMVPRFIKFVPEITMTATGKKSRV
jgi:acyl-coenzyme A synthetase/AMP-(fatty) acid ligase